MSSECCPPGSLPYLEPTWSARGQIVQAEKVELYVSPPPPEPPVAGLLLCPDVWGWNGGRVRAIADGFAAEGYLVAVGKFLSTPAKDGGTDGDALPPGGSFDLEWMSSNFSWPKQQPKVAGALAYLKSRLAELQGPCKIGVVGFCYGGHPACFASVTDPDVRCGAVFHPSMQLEGAFGGDAASLMRQVRCPFLLAPAGNDLETWGFEAPLSEALRASAKGSACEWKAFPDMAHGWTCRGDLADAAVARDIDEALKAAKLFLAKHL